MRKEQNIHPHLSRIAELEGLEHQSGLTITTEAMNDLTSPYISVTRKTQTQNDRGNWHGEWKRRRKRARIIPATFDD